MSEGFVKLGGTQKYIQGFGWENQKREVTWNMQGQIGGYK
jgi:hypothetical protein